MKNQQNHLKKISIIHTNNTENNQENKIYPYNKKNTLTKQLNNNKNNYIIKQYNTINDVNRITKRIYRPKMNSNIDVKINDNINKRENDLNKNQNGKIHLTRNSESKLPSYNYIKSNPIYNTFKKTIDQHNLNNSNFHVINQSKRNIETEPDNKEKNKIYKNHSTTFISGLSKQSQEKKENESKNKKIYLNKNINININKNNFFKNIPKINLTKLKEISKDYRKKAQTSRSLLINNKSEEIKDNKNQNIEKEENKVKFSRRLEITEKTEVLLPNQTFKPFEQFEKKEKPIIEIKKNKDGNNMKVVKEILIKTTIENSLINVPKIQLVKNAPQVNLIKQKITKEYITTIKFYSNINDFKESFNINNNNINNNKLETQRKINNSNHELVEIKPEKQINAKNGQNIINQEKEFKINNDPLTDKGTNGFENKNNLYKNSTNEKSKRNIKNTVYSNVINNNINKPHKKNNNPNKNANIDNMIRKNISNKNFHTISNIHRKNKYNIGNGNLGINTNLNLQENNDRNARNNNINMNENSNLKKNMNNNLITAKDFNNIQMMSNESQLISNIYNVNGSLNSFSMSESKVSSKVFFDFPFNLDFEKNESEKLEEKERIIFNEKGNNEKNEEKKMVNNNGTKLEILNEFIIKFNDEKEKSESNNNSPNGENNISEEIKSPLIDKQSGEKILNQMQLSNLNLALKDSEEIENDDNNGYCGENTNNVDRRDLTGSIMFINSNIDKNIHIQNGLENCSINIDGNSITDNFNIIEGENLSPNNDKDFIEKLELIKNKINNENKNEEFIENSNIDEKEEEIENEEKFFRPLNKYENKFNLDQINPF